MTVMSIRELSHNTSAVMDRVAHGDTIEIAKRGKVIAVIQIAPVLVAVVSYERRMLDVAQFAGLPVVAPGMLN
jgi:prevent-host-death family protein